MTRRPLVLFVCLHGSAKSVIALEHFRRLAAERGVAVDADSAGTEPDAEIPPRVVQGLLGESIDVRGRRPARWRGRISNGHRAWSPSVASSATSRRLGLRSSAGPEVVLSETQRIAAPRSHRSCSYGGRTVSDHFLSALRDAGRRRSGNMSLLRRQGALDSRRADPFPADHASLRLGWRHDPGRAAAPHVRRRDVRLGRQRARSPASTRRVGRARVTLMR